MSSLYLLPEDFNIHSLEQIIIRLEKRLERSRAELRDTYNAIEVGRTDDLVGDRLKTDIEVLSKRMEVISDVDEQANLRRDIYALMGLQDEVSKIRDLANKKITIAYSKVGKTMRSDGPPLLSIHRPVAYRSSSAIKESRRDITRKRRLEVWERWIGADCGSVDCPLCLTSKIKPLDGSSWNVSHVIPRCHGGGIEVDNLRVICSGCNSSMSSMNMRDYCEVYHPSAIARLCL